MRSTSRLMRMRRTDRRALEHARRTPDDGGIAADFAARFDFGDPRGWPGTEENFRARAAAWMGRPR